MISDCAGAASSSSSSFQLAVLFLQHSRICSGSRQHVARPGAGRVNRTARSTRTVLLPEQQPFGLASLRVCPHLQDCGRASARSGRHGRWRNRCVADWVSQQFCRQDAIRRPAQNSPRIGVACNTTRSGSRLAPAWRLEQATSSGPAPHRGSAQQQTCVGITGETGHTFNRKDVDDWALHRMLSLAPPVPTNQQRLTCRRRAV